MKKKNLAALAAGVLSSVLLFVMGVPPASANYGGYYRGYADADYAERHCQDISYNYFTSIREGINRVCVEIAYRRQNDGSGVTLEAMSVAVTPDVDNKNQTYGMNVGVDLPWGDTSNVSTWRCAPSAYADGSQGPDYDGPTITFADGPLSDGGICMGDFYDVNDKDGDPTEPGDFVFRDLENKGNETGDTEFKLALKLRNNNGDDVNPVVFSITAEVSHV